MPLFGSPSIDKLKERKDTKGLKKLLEGKGDAAIRKEAVAALGEIGGAGAFDALVAAINDPDKGVRAEAAKSLGALGDLRGVEPILTRLEGSDEFGAAFQKGLVQIYASTSDTNEKQAMADLMLDVLAGGQLHPQVAAAVVVGTIVEDPVIDSAYILKAEQALLDAIVSGDDYLQHTAIGSLAVCFKRQASDHLYAPVVEVLSQPKILRQPGLRKLALELVLAGLAHVDTSQKREDLQAAFLGHTDDNRFEIREMCFRGLGEVGDDTVVKSLVIDCIADVNKACQMAAFQAAGKINPVFAKDFLLKQVELFDLNAERSNPYKTNWRGAVQVLGELGQDWAIAPLQAITQKADFEPIVGNAADQALEAIKQKIAP